MDLSNFAYTEHGHGTRPKRPQMSLSRSTFMITFVTLQWYESYGCLASTRGLHAEVGSATASLAQRDCVGTRCHLPKSSAACGSGDARAVVLGRHLIEQI